MILAYPENAYRKILRIAFYLFAAYALHSTAFSQRYVAGDIVENFSLIDRATGQPVSLSDFEGSIIFLEWFAYWCPFCQAAAEDIESGIVGYYENRGGNVNGVPVVHIGINLQGDAEELSQDFIDRYNIQRVLNDFDRTIAARFQPANQPIFAIINGVANTPSHEQWELLYTRLGYGELAAPLSTFRDVIDSVAAPLAVQLPSITGLSEGGEFASNTSLDLDVTFESDATTSFQWFKNDQPIPNALNQKLSIASLASVDAGSYRVELTNEAGTVTSESIEISVYPSFTDWITVFELPDNLQSPTRDPDGDSFPNFLEYFAQTNPTSSASKPLNDFSITATGGASSAQFRFQINDSIPAESLVLNASPDPSFETDASAYIETREIIMENDLLFLRILAPLGDTPQFFRAELQLPSE